MITFFRKIRQQLLTEKRSGQIAPTAGGPDSRLGRYLLYAIGEIVLVVLGILIALQINNWNESKIRQKTLDNYKERLIRQFETDSVTLQSHNRGHEFFQSKLDTLDSVFRQNLQGRVSGDSIIKVPIFITLQSEFVSATTVIDELFYTGNLDLFEDVHLKDLMAAYKKAIARQHDLIARSESKFDDFDKLLHQVAKYSEREYLIPAGKIASDYFMNEYWFIHASRGGNKMMYDEIEKMNNEILILLKTGI